MRAFRMDPERQAPGCRCYLVRRVVDSSVRPATLSMISPIRSMLDRCWLMAGDGGGSAGLLVTSGIWPSGRTGSGIGTSVQRVPTWTREYRSRTSMTRASRRDGRDQPPVERPFPVAHEQVRDPGTSATQH